MHIPERVLKKRQLNASSKALPAVEVRLMHPAFEPTLLARICLNNRKGEAFSIQFAADGEDEFHYLNIPHDPGFHDDARLECIVVADLPVKPARVWRVIVADPGAKPVEIGELSQARTGAWRYRSQGALERDDASQTAVSPPSILFVGGPPKSGTTWVERILNSHPEALATGENNLFRWPARIKLVELMRERPPPSFAFAVPQRAPFLSQLVHLYAGRAEAILSQIADIAGVRLVADKTPTNGMHVPEILEARADWRYLHCLRNPLDVAVSRFFHERNLMTNAPNVAHLTRDESLRAHILGFDSSAARPGEMFSDIRLLDLFIDESLMGVTAADFAESDPDRVHLAYYEDLLSEPDREIGAMLQFCGLPAGQQLVAEIVEANRFESYSGGRTAGQASEKSFFRKGIAGDHVNYLTDRQIDYAAARIRMRTRHFDRYFT